MAPLTQRFEKSYHPPISLAKKRWHFFKIVLPSIIQDQKLGIPRKFVRKLGKEMSDVAVLKVPNGHVWHVGLRKADGEVWFQSGWQEFVEYHSIRAGHFLVFRYDGNSHFYVLIFDMSGNEIDYLRNSDKFEEPNRDGGCLVPKKKEIKDSVKILGVSPPCQTPASSVEVVDGFEDQTTKRMDNRPGLQHSVRFSVQSSVVKRTTSTCETELRFNKRRSRRFAHSDSLSSIYGSLSSRKKKRSEDEGKTRKLANGNESNRVGQNRSEEFAFNFENKSEAVSIHSDSPSNDEPAMSTQHESSSSRANKDNWHPTTKNTDNPQALATSVTHIGAQFDGVNFKKSKTDEVESHCCNRESRSKDIQVRQVNRRTEPDRHHVSVKQAGGSMNVPKIHSDSGDFVTKKPVSRQEKDRAIQAAKAFKSENPFFMVIMRRTYVCGKFNLNVPFNFITAHLRKVSHDVTLGLSDGRTWLARCHLYEGMAKIYAGWRSFVRENNLGEGDVCVFEAVKTEEPVLKVFIFRVIEDVTKPVRPAKPNAIREPL